MSARIGVIVMTIALVLYFILAGQRAWLWMVSGEPIAVAMGIAMLFFPVLAAWGIGRELMFGVSAQRLGRQLEAEGALPEDEVATYVSGRVHRDEGDALFPKYRAAVEAAPEDWRAWYRMGLVYDAAGDRRRARQAVRQSIALERRQRRERSTT